MQGKGAGAVNRVELECQVLCAALRQSWVRRDKVGAFTSIRELSHLFPDLLPPPEERVSTNKANYYEVLGVRPQSGLNSIVVGYLRTTRKFLKQYNAKDHRAFYNTMLNAGFVLRKPRLRLSHDLVVARRWLYDSQLQDEDEDVIPEDVADADIPVAPAPMPDTPPVSQVQGATPLAVANQETQQAEIDPLAAAEAAWAASQGQGQGVPVQSSSSSSSEIPLPQNLQDPAAPTAQNSKPPAVPAEPTPPAIPVQETPIMPAAVAPPPVIPEPSHEQAPPEFRFDESQLRKPDVDVELPAVIRLMEASHLISKLEVQALKAQMVLASNIPAEQLVINAGYATRLELASLRLAQDLLSAGKITMAQFQVAMYDERTSGLRMAESLQVRGWLETEVKNPIENLKQQNT